MAWWESLPRDRFGDTPELQTELAELVVAGRKRATCSAAATFDPQFAPGVQWVAENGSGEPVCVLETTSIETRRFDEVDEAFAREEGEGDLTLAWWRDAHRRFFEREGTYAPDMLVVCERFRLVERLEGAQ